MKAKLDVVELDILNDETIVKAAKYVEEKYGRLDGKLLSTIVTVYIERKRNEEIRDGADEGT